MDAGGFRSTYGRSRGRNLGCGAAALAVLTALWLPSTATASTASWSFTPKSWDFGSRLLEEGPSESKAFTLENTGEVSLSPVFFSLASEADAGFKLNGNNCAPLAPGESCSVKVVFEPPTVGKKEAALEVSEAHGKVSPAVAMMTGTGVGPKVSIAPASVNFGDLEVGAPPLAPSLITITDEGPGKLALSEVSVKLLSDWVAEGSWTPHPVFQLAEGGCEAGLTLSPGSACPIEVSFAPPSLWGGFEEEVQITDNAADSPQSIPLTGRTFLPPVTRPTGPPPRIPPWVIIKGHPAKRTRSVNATFRFTGNEPGAWFQCQLDEGPFRRCTSPLRYRSLKPRQHRLSIRPFFPSGGAETRRFHWTVIK